VKDSDVPRKANVLLVDDNPANLTVLDAVLHRDYNVVRADSGPRAIQILAERTDIDVVLLDVQMPGMDGFETATRIKELPHAEDVPIIFVTAVYSEDPFIKRGYAVGGVDYFTKPFDPDLLKLKVGIYASFRLKTELLRERERRSREAAQLAMAGRDLSAALEQLPVGAFVTDVAGRVVQITDETSRILKASGSDPQQRYVQLLEWFRSEGQAIAWPEGPLHRAVSRGEATIRLRLQLWCLDRSMAEIAASVLPLRAADGSVAGAVILIRDASTTREIESELEERATRLVAPGPEPGGTGWH
jgi:CheY-like chemotaxis protein